MNSKQNDNYDVIIIGGGITGAGTARDCALRGLKVLLVEKFDFTNGATGRNHGLLHSGARYAVTDPESATECIKENMVLRRIAKHCIEETDGLFITLPEDDINYQKTFASPTLTSSHSQMYKGWYFSKHHLSRRGTTLGSIGKSRPSRCGTCARCICRPFPFDNC